MNQKPIMKEASGHPSLSLDYYYGTEIDINSFYCMPKILFRNKALKDLSSEAKLLYTLLLDRAKLSCLRNLRDDQNRIFIFYTIEEACYELDKSNKTVTRFFADLTKLGLIEKQKRGQGKADKIYVKNLNSLSADFPPFYQTKNDTASMNTAPRSKETCNASQIDTTKMSIPQQCVEKNHVKPTYMENSDLSTFSSPHTPLSVDNFLPNSNLHLKNHNSDTFRHVDNTILDRKNVHTNNPYQNKKEINNTDFFKSTLPNQPTEQENKPGYFSETTIFHDHGVAWQEMERDMKEEVICSILTNQLNYAGQYNVLSIKELTNLFYSLKNNTEALEITLDLLMNINSYKISAVYNTEDFCKDKLLYNTFLLYKQSLLNMLTNPQTKTKHGFIMYYDVIQAIVSHIVINEYNSANHNNALKFDDMALSTVEAYINASNASQTPIRHKVSYMQSCIWTTILEGCISVQADFSRFASSARVAY